MKFASKKTLVLVTLLSITSYNVATQVEEPMVAQRIETKDIEFIKKTKWLRTSLLAKLRETGRVWKTLPVASAIKLWGESKSLITEPTFSEVEALLKKGQNKEAIAVFDDFVVATIATSRVKVTN